MVGEDVGVIWDLYGIYMGFIWDLYGFIWIYMVLNHEKLANWNMI
jgi:hypothetical protein